jgi:uncharacterized repeat protein (TIGR04052 family)
MRTPHPFTPCARIDQSVFTLPRKRRVRRALVAMVLAGGVLQGCGGGGGDQVNRATAAAPTGTVTAIPLVAASTLNGVVAVGHPVVGATVQARCLGGEVQANALTDSQGAYVMDLVGVSAPCLVQATGGAAAGVPITQPMHGLALSAGLAQVNPLSDIALARLWRRAPADVFLTFDGREAVPSRAALAEARSWLSTQLADMALEAPVTDVFNGEFAIGDANDQLLDALAQALAEDFASLSDVRLAAQNDGTLRSALAQARSMELARRQAEEEARLAAAAAEAESDTLRGLASAGEPIVSAQVQVRCASGQPQSGTLTDESGRFAVRLYGATLPCLIQVVGGQSAGQPYTLPLHGWVDARQPRQALVTPLSELVLQHALKAPPADALPAWGGTITPPDTAAIDASRDWLRSELSELGLPTLPEAVLTGPWSVATSTVLQGLLTRIHDKDSSLATLLPVSRLAGSLRATIDADRAVSITFEARSGDTPVACGQVLDKMGSTQASGRLMDFRFYISEARLIRADGTLVPLALGSNTVWQYTSAQGDAVTLIDLEDGTDACGEEGSAGKNALINGTVPAGRYTGLLMTLGVPQALNHSDTAKAPAPLDSVAMGWGWQAGRKFMKIELTEAVERSWPLRSPTFYVHLGSTNCVGSAVLGTVKCGVPNRGLIRLDDFDSRTHKIVVDIQSLLAGTNVTINQGGSGGCMSQGTDLDCLHVFEALGIDWASNGAGTGLPLQEGPAQTTFRKVSK